MGNLLSRADGVNGQTETFSYDGLNRLVAIGSRQIRYDSRGNILSMDGIGSMTYGNTARPYQITMLTPEGTGLSRTGSRAYPIPATAVLPS